MLNLIQAREGLLGALLFELGKFLGCEGAKNYEV